MASKKRPLPTISQILEARKKQQGLCERCKKPNAMRRSIKNKDYVGPCGDSFCYAGCDMDACKTPQHSLTLCESCAKDLAA